MPTVEARVAELERALGDPDDPHNPFSAAEFLAADRRRSQLPAVERLLDNLGLNSEFVPPVYGGRLAGQDALARIMRAVYRRDAALGLGHGLTSYLAAAVVWAGGGARQCRETAELLLGGGRMACACPESAPGSVFLQNGLVAARSGRGHLLSGHKDAMNGVGRAGALVLFAATGPLGEAAGAGSHSAFLLPTPPEVPGEAQAAGGGRHSRMALLPRRRTGGVRGCLVQGLRFTEYPLGEGQLIGEEGGGRALLDRVFPAVRSTGPSMALGTADTALRTAAAFALRAHGGGRRYGHGADGTAPADRAGRTLAGVFADLLACDCLALAATRSVDLLPAESGVLAAAADYLLPAVLGEALHELSGVLGTASYATHGPYALFRKAARDLPFTGLGAPGAAASRDMLVRHLLRHPRLLAPPGGTDAAGRLFLTDRDRTGPPPSAQARTSPRMPPWPQGTPAPTATGDSLLPALDDTASLLRPGGSGRLTGVLGEPATLLAAELRQLRRGCAEMTAAPPGQRSAARMYALADRYALLAAGTAALRVWGAATRQGGGFLSCPDWAALALARLLMRLGAPVPRPPGAVVGRLFTEVAHRCVHARSFDLYDTPIGR